MANAGFLSSLPYVFQFSVGIISSLTADILSQKGFTSNLTLIRKSYFAIGALPGVIMMSLIPAVNCNTAAVLAFIIVAAAFQGFCGSALCPNYIDLSPKYSGLMHGLCDTLQSAAGFVVPIIMGSIIQGDPYEPSGWATFWYISAASAGIGLLLFTLFGSAQEQISWYSSEIKTSKEDDRNIIDEIE